MSKIRAKILVVDDNSGIRGALQILLPRHFSDVELISSPNGLLSKMGEFSPDAVLLDMNFHTDINTGNEGLFWLGEIKRSFPSVEVVLFTAYADIQLAVEGMKRGAFDFIVKPWDNDKLVDILTRAAQNHRKVSKGRSAGATSPATQMLWGHSPRMEQISRTIGKVAPTDATILITGENGTGKDVLANEIHRLSARSGKPMVSVDAGAITETLFESELFGHVKGAFTDAHADKVGKFEMADGGTLFLDEIGNIPLHLQAKLLRVLQNRMVTKVGDTKSIPIDVRLICATNKDLDKMVREGEFREDLYYRINTMRLMLPPLRERTDEISPLAHHFIKRYAQKYGREVTSIEPEAEKMLLSNYWSGNIRELQNTIEKAVILSEGEKITCSDLQLAPMGNTPPHSSVPPVEETLDMAEERAIRSAMERYSGNLSLVAKSLDISRPTLYSKLKKYNI